ncbi:response regulator transcription factor [Paenibacillus sp. ACRRY]|uniref:helix-turn-helix transcriptional regulator n=1 Tax=Paenibacillus sp. ACRRY TaxID=2918208 RepID=UPI001EF72190|nr:response regulator transcription factor [Paenibacillus sp. ACRRY]MCG7381402.1 helix-turn-helix domain-containing protein [Paenibacillus sp. ACRRY]
MNVLLVDDEPLELEQLEFLIQPHFPYWRLHKAADGTQANAIGQEMRIQLALLDINLPGKSGLLVAEDLRRLHPDIHIIIISAHHNFQYARQSIKLKVMDYITKPVIEQELLEVLHQFDASGSPQVQSKVIQEALQILHKHFAGKINLSSLAAAVHINPAYLSRLFHEEVGTSFSEYVNRLRVENAKQLLFRHPELNIADVAERCGFNSQHYFCTLFHKHEGMPPKKYREKRALDAINSFTR